MRAPNGWTSSAFDAPEDLARRARAAGAIALFLDVDGTLLRIAPTPDSVTVEPGTPEVLDRLQRSNGGALALISGRRIEELDRLLAPLVLPIAGQHGLERRDAAGVVRRYANAPPQLSLIGSRLDAFARAHPGVLIENKQLAIAAHYRLAPQAESKLATLITTLADESPGLLEVQHGKMVFELRPRGTTKGTAIAAFMAEAPFRGRMPLFIGDDDTDEHGFDVVNELGGISVKVGDGATAAHLRLESVEAVHQWLRWHAPGVTRA